jgi:hypothetical protein
MTKIASWTPVPDDESHSGWYHDDTGLCVRVHEAAETGFGLPDDREYRKWVVAVYLEVDATLPLEILGSKSTVSDGRSMGFSYIRNNTAGTHPSVRVGDDGERVRSAGKSVVD